jgi:hypothetical protein
VFVRHYIHALVEQRSLDAQAVTDRFNLAVSKVYHALAYYYDHPEEMGQGKERHKELHAGAEDDPRIIIGPEDIPES